MNALFLHMSVYLQVAVRKTHEGRKHEAAQVNRLKEAIPQIGREFGAAPFIPFKEDLWVRIDKKDAKVLKSGRNDAVWKKKS